MVSRVSNMDGESIGSVLDWVSQYSGDIALLMLPSREVTGVRCMSERLNLSSPDTVALRMTKDQIQTRGPPGGRRRQAGWRGGSRGEVDGGVECGAVGAAGAGAG